MIQLRKCIKKEKILAFLRYVKENIFVIYGAILAIVIVSSLLFQLFCSAYIDSRAQKLVDVLQGMEIIQRYSMSSPTIEGGLFAQKGVYVVLKADKNKEEFSDELRQYFLSKNYTIDSIRESGSINVYNDLYIINVEPIYKRDNSYTGKWLISIYYNNILTTLNL